jgi:hypothetical protein
MGLLRDLQSSIEQRGLTGGDRESGHASIAITDVCGNGFGLVRPSLTSLINQRKPARCCRFVAEKNPERGGKVRKTRPQTVESNEIKVMEKTLNQ